MVDRSSPADGDIQGKASSGSPHPRPGFGVTHPVLGSLLIKFSPSAVERVVWPEDMMLDVAAYPVVVDVPDELVMSVRCIVRVGDDVLVCETPEGTHIWPGGRRLPGEGYEATARREVYEETGWLIEEPMLHRLGFLHFRFVRPKPRDHPLPHPDFLQLVYYTEARKQATDGKRKDWKDLDGWELGSRLVAISQLPKLPLSPTQWAFLRSLKETSNQEQ